jgi:hypothetical protein
LKVIQYDINGILLKTWDALSDIERELGISTTNISKCCKGHIKTLNGFIFLYKDGIISDRLNHLKNRRHKSKTEKKYERI